MPKKTNPIKMNTFRGINNIDNPEDISEKFFQEADNIDLNDRGQIRKRDGYTLLQSGDVHSLYSNNTSIFFVKDDNLYRDWIMIASNIDSKLSYLTLQNKVYFTSKTITGIIDGDQVTPWTPVKQTNFLKINAWEDQFGHAYDGIDHEPIFYQKGPTGQCIAGMGGRIYIANDSSLLFTEPMAPLWFVGASIEFNHRITALMPTESGMWVSADALYFLSGLDPESFKVNRLEDCIGIEGTAVKVPGDRAPIEKSPAGDTWLISTSNGIMALKDNGFISNLSEANYELPSAEYGTAGFIESGGVNRYVTNIQNNKSDRAAFSDSMTVKIIRNS